MRNVRYKRSDRGGKKKGCWYAAYVDAHGARIRFCTDTRDKEVAAQILAKRETIEAEKSHGIIDAATERLVAQGDRPLDDHVSELIASIHTAGRSAQHRQRTRQQIDRAAAFGQWTSLGDITAESAEAYVSHLMTVHNRSARTIQSMLTALKRLTLWAVRSGRMAVDPLGIVRKPDHKPDRRSERRMILPTEWPYLMTATHLRRTACHRGRAGQIDSGCDAPCDG